MTDAQVLQRPNEDLSTYTDGEEVLPVAVTLHTGQELAVGGPLPSEPESKILRIFEREDGAAVIFAVPKVGSPADNARRGFVDTIPAMGIIRFHSFVRYDIWKEMVAEFLEGDEEEDDTETNDIIVPAQPVAVAAQNGA